MSPPLPPLSSARPLVSALSEARVALLVVDPESHGQRLDNFLIRHLKGVPKTHVYRIIRSGEVRVNKGRAQADTRVEAGQRVRLPPIRLPERLVDTEATPKAPARCFDVLFENERWLAIDKPAGVAVHGGSGVSFGVIEQLRAARPEAQFLELVHRLDRETSGILLIAKRRSALVALQDQFRSRSIHKTYLALVHGQWPKSKKVIDIPLFKYLTPEGERRVRFARDDDGDDGEPEGKRAISLVKLDRVFSGSELAKEWSTALGAQAKVSLLQVTIKTGRTHQIRVHTSGSGYPIVGDDKYGRFAENKAMAKLGISQMFLHAWRLEVGAFEGSEAQVIECAPRWQLWRDLCSNG